MKEGIHPNFREVVFQDMTNGKQFIIRSTAPAREKITIRSYLSQMSSTNSLPNVPVPPVMITLDTRHLVTQILARKWRNFHAHDEAILVVKISCSH
ncbi:MAG: hypothetical protein EBW52_08470 [Betaproteobacteria bacterium]|nr:hypothetical protein [Betaproteobacteria bacterium]